MVQTQIPRDPSSFPAVIFDQQLVAKIKIIFGYRRHFMENFLEILKFLIYPPRGPENQSFEGRGRI